MKILIEAHHAAHIHFWKYPVRELQNRGHHVLMIARDRDVMIQLLQAYSWINAEMPKRRSKANRFPLLEMLQRQCAVASAIRKFMPDVVASLMGSYTQSAKLFGIRNIIFTDTETQAFNHRIAHPFADEIHTPFCFYLGLGKKHQKYAGLHELSFLDRKYFKADDKVLEKYGNLGRGKYIIIRTSAWNTFHDMGRRGIGDEVFRFIESVKDRYRIIISAEENRVPPALEKYRTQFNPVDFHSLINYAAFVLTEGASTASESACLGVPSVFINSVGRLGNFDLLDGSFNLLKTFDNPQAGISYAINWVNSLSVESMKKFYANHQDLLNGQIDVCEYVVNTVLNQS